tara:strand:- start:3108 stop:4493 length:1386 start_codon:yes stop_codon:yes gene_type:complete
MHATWNNSYARLPEQMFARQTPTPVKAPASLVLNTELAEALGITFDENWPEFIAGNQVPDGAYPIAQAYAGHQFGHWNPQLGDGRAVLLGEVLSDLGRVDIQLKGSGRTPWSRGGDGRAWYGPVLREYLISESMHALGIPTTRALAAAATGENIQREPGPLPGAVICRTASSHIRVGTFQYFASRDDIEALQALLDHAIFRHYPDVKNTEDFLKASVSAQAHLIAQWMGVGFIHGVMNTDNSHVGGITIDYGPCAFMDDYVPAKVFSSIDRQGRYGYNNQPNLAAWNMAQLATALLPLANDTDAAIEQYTNIVQEFSDLFKEEYTKIFSQKIGLKPSSESAILIKKMLEMMEQTGADFTQSFRALGSDEISLHIGEHPEFRSWHDTWSQTANLENLNQINPALIARNHTVESMITKSVAGDMQLFHDFHMALKSPFVTPQNLDFTATPKANEVIHQTFCGT